jgi:hypothetical protein
VREENRQRRQGKKSSPANLVSWRPWRSSGVLAFLLMTEGTVDVTVASAAPAVRAVNVTEGTDG